jgi:hypothetical protein
MLRRAVWYKFNEGSEMLAAVIIMALSDVALLMEAASTFETSVNFYQTALRNFPEDSYLHTRSRESVKSHQVCGQESRRYRSY